MKSFNYECFVRSAFSIHLDTTIEKSNDPAALANADIFDLAENSTYYFNKVKIGTSYAILIFNNEILNNFSLPENEQKILKALLNQVLLATSLDDITSIINQYKPYRDKYIVFNWNKNDK